ncbi:MAG: glycosyltransferase family 39 protein [Leptolyngbya sp. SIO1D8]|nr:glycosyltransferase family 39 protein [Leptolyngbya sp. SIO1D8]
MSHQVLKTAHITHHKMSLYASLFALCIALTYYYRAVIGIDIFNTYLPDLGPMPDGQEYLAGAISLLNEGRFGFRIGDDFLPSRYPFAYPVLLVPFVYFLEKKAVILAPYLANQTLGIIILIGTFLFFFCQKRFMAAGIAVLLLVTLPAFVIFSRSSMSENLGALTILAIFLLLYLAAKKSNFRYIVFASFILGLSLSVRLQHVLLAPALGAILLINSREASRRKLSIWQLLSVPLAFLVAVTPLLLYNWKTFGSPCSTGYDFWVPGSIAFKLEFILPNLLPIWNEFSLSQDAYRVAHIFGPGVYLTSPFIFLSIVSILRGFLSANLKSLAMMIAATVFCVGTLLYRFSNEGGVYFWDERFIYPLMILSIFPIADFFESSFRQRSFTKIRVKSCLILLLLLTLIGFPSIAGYPAKFTFSQTGSLLDRGYLGDRSFMYSTTVEYLETYDDGTATLIITDMVPFFVNSLLNENATVIPASGAHTFGFSTAQWKFDSDDRDQYIQRFLNKDDRIIFLSKEKLNTGIDPAFPNIPKQVWKKLSVSTDSLIYELISK